MIGGNTLIGAGTMSTMDLPLRLFSGVRKTGPLVISHMLLTGNMLKKLAETQKKPKFNASWT